MRKISVFVSFAHPDWQAKNALLKELSTLRLDSAEIEPLLYEENKSGEWREQIERYITRSQIGILLLSETFLNSDHCAQELTAILDRRFYIRVVPVLLEKCDWKDRFPQLEKFHFPLLQKSVRAVRDRRKAWRSIRNFIEREAKDIAKTSSGQWILEQDRSRLWDAVQSGLFTPVLGPACHSVTEEWEKARPHLELRVSWISAHLKRAAEENYLQSVLDGNVRGQKVRVPRGKAYEESGWRRTLITFQVALTRVGVEASELFTKAMGEEIQSFADINNLQVSLVSLQKERQPLLDSLIEAVKVVEALELSLVAEPPELGLGLIGIKRQLIWLTWTVFSQDLLNRKVKDSEVGAWVDRYPFEGLTSMPQFDTPSLHMSQVEWIADLLWHTLRFDVPLYPTRKELAFQFSLCFSRAPGIEHGTDETAVPEEESARTALIRRILADYHGSDRSQKREVPVLYRALVGAACYRLGEVQEQFGIDLSRAEPSRNAYLRAERSPRLVINANLDMEVEQAFEKKGLSFDVLLPVYVEFSRWDGPVRRAPDWLLGFDDRRRGQPTWMLWGNRFESNVIQRLRDRIGFPLVVKLYGSPLQPLPAPQEVSVETAIYLEDAQVKQVTHRLMLSDYDLLKPALLAGLRELLADEGRRICFIGYPVTDLVSRMQLYNFLTDGSSFSRALAVDSPRDPGQSAFLDYMGVELVQMDIDQMVRVVEGMPDPT
jgi:TIR domain-containing protein